MRGEPVIGAALVLDIPILNRVQNGREQSAEANASKSDAQRAFARDRVVADVRNAVASIDAAQKRAAMAEAEARVAATLAEALKSDGLAPPPREDDRWPTFGGAPTRDRVLAETGQLAAVRAHQAQAWLWDEIRSGLLERFRSAPSTREQLADLEAQVAAGEVSPTVAAQRLLEGFSG